MEKSTSLPEFCPRILFNELHGRKSNQPLSNSPYPHRSRPPLRNPNRKYEHSRPRQRRCIVTRIPNGSRFRRGSLPQTTERNHRVKFEGNKGWAYSGSVQSRVPTLLCVERSLLSAAFAFVFDSDLDRLVRTRETSSPSTSFAAFFLCRLFQLTAHSPPTTMASSSSLHAPGVHPAVGFCQPLSANLLGTQLKYEN